jgi:type II secretory pathway predicted ATPase ExeA
MPTFSFEKEPFPESGSEEFYFSTPALTARLGEVREAVRRGHVLLIDEQASGKSSMLDNLVAAQSGQWRIFRLQASGQQSAKALLHDLMSAFGLPIREPAAAELRDADTLLELLSSRSQLAVILIDDVHRLERDALEQLAYLVRRWQAYGVRFLICAEPRLTAQLACLDNDARLPDPVETFSMPRFEHEQVSDYLHMCLYRAGLVGDSPFDSASVALVADRANGLVGAIDPVARELLKASGSDRRDRGVRGQRQTGMRRWPAALLAVAGLGIFLTLAVPGPSASQADKQARDRAEVFQSSITLAPRESIEDMRNPSATADSIAP